MPLMGSIQRVITSYSIHYTKLYEANAPAEVIESEREKVAETSRRIAKLGSYVKDLQYRITSYNVCYTKLLRQTWTASALLHAFSSESDVQNVLEDNYRNRILSIKKTQSSAVKLGLDLSGGMSIIIKADLDAAAASQKEAISDMATFKKDAMAQAMDILNSRIDKFGLSEPVIRQQGEDRIYIEIPGAADSDRINSLIMGKGMLSFHIVDSEASAAFNEYYQQHPTSTFDAE